jgi:hypothetical protein
MNATRTPSPELEIKELIAVWREDGVSDKAIISVLEATIAALRAGSVVSRRRIIRRGR